MCVYGYKGCVYACVCMNMAICVYCSSEDFELVDLMLV